LFRLCSALPQVRICGENEVYDPCGNHCEPTCSFTRRGCIAMCGPAACICKEGFYRNSAGECTKDCSKGNKMLYLL
ncbi:trypsin Inhibitor like cysteine rich domain protein, partial [Oesophagostomum dentatum]